LKFQGDEEYHFDQANERAKAMRRTVLFLSRFLLGLWVVLIGAFLLLLFPNAPNVPNNPFAGFSIRTEQNTIIHLPNRIFTCTEIAKQLQCQAELQGRSLNVNLTKEDYYEYDLSNCQAQYDGRSIGCREVGMTYAPMLSELYEITDLRLNPQELRAIEREYWSINALTRLGEVRLLWISTGLSLAAGLSALFFTWLHPGNLSKGFASFACGFGMHQFVTGLLGRVPYDLVTPYGLTPDTWNWVVFGGAIATGIGTMLATAILLWRRLNRITNLLIGISSSIGIYSLCLWSLSWNSNYILSFFSFADALVQHGNLIMRFSVIVSIVLAIVAAILLCLRTNQSIKRFLCMGCGFGAMALVTNLLMFILLNLGYVD
jgi:hypothetical protein